MLVHGAYVFTGVSHYWRTIQQSERDDKDGRENAGFHSYYRARQAQAAMHIVDKYCGRTALGRKVSDIINQGIEQVLAAPDISVSTIEEANRRLSEHRVSHAGFLD